MLFYACVHKVKSEISRVRIFPWHQSHFFRLRSCSKIFESGSGYSSNLRLLLLFRLRLQSSIQP